MEENPYNVGDRVVHTETRRKATVVYSGVTRNGQSAAIAVKWDDGSERDTHPMLLEYFRPAPVEEETHLFTADETKAIGQYLFDEVFSGNSDAVPILIRFLENLEEHDR